MSGNSLVNSSAGDEPVFNDPWQAQAFALVNILHAKGLFSWSEWAQHLSSAISKAQSEGDVDNGSTYYQHWLSALETLLLAKEIIARDDFERMKQAWKQAAENTPHGEPIAPPNVYGQAVCRCDMLN